MDRNSKVKLLLPVSYAILSIIYFIAAWPTTIEPHHILGATIAIASFILWITSRIQLGNAFSLAPKSKYLVTSGMYSRLRHPVYYFSITAIAGICLFIWQAWTLVSLAILITLEMMRISAEERLLTKSFGEEYIAYKKTTWI